MKKLFFAVLAVVLMGASTFAAAPERKYELTFGPIYTWSNSAQVQSFSGISNETLKASFRDDVGLYVGAFLPLTKNFGFYPGFTMNWNSLAKLTDKNLVQTDVKYQSYIFDLDARYNFQFQFGTIYLMAGPTITSIRPDLGDWTSKLGANAGVGMSVQLFNLQSVRFALESRYRVNPKTFFGPEANRRPDTWTAFAGLTFKF